MTIGYVLHTKWELHWTAIIQNAVKSQYSATVNLICDGILKVVKVKVKVSHNRLRWLKGFQVG